MPASPIATAAETIRSSSIAAMESWAVSKGCEPPPPAKSAFEAFVPWMPLAIRLRMHSVRAAVG